MKQLKSLLALGGMALALTLAAPAQASIVTYSSEAAFLGATSGVSTIDFNGIAAPGSFVGYGTGPLALPGATFTSNSTMFVIDPGFYGSSYAGGGFLNSDFAALNIITATLDASATAIGLDFGGLFSGPVTFTFTFSDGSTAVASTGDSVVGNSLLDFVGFTSTVAITSLDIAMPDSPDYNAIDNFRFGTAGAAVPEPGSLVLVGLALLGLAGVRRRAR